MDNLQETASAKIRLRSVEAQTDHVGCEEDEGGEEEEPHKSWREQTQGGEEKDGHCRADLRLPHVCTLLYILHVFCPNFRELRDSNADQRAETNMIRTRNRTTSSKFSPGNHHHLRFLTSPCLHLSAMSTEGTSVPLPRQNNTQSKNSTKPPVWPLESRAGGEPVPLPAKCAREEHSGVCCKELRGDDERTLIDPDVVRDM